MCWSSWANKKWKKIDFAVLSAEMEDVDWKKEVEEELARGRKRDRNSNEAVDEEQPHEQDDGNVEDDSESIETLLQQLMEEVQDENQRLMDHEPQGGDFDDNIVCVVVHC